VLDKLRQELEDTTHSLISESTREMPESFSTGLHSCIKHTYNLDLSLLACASSMWCGSSESAGMPVAITTLMLRAGILVHLDVNESTFLFDRLNGLLDNRDDTLAILVGDGLIALAIEYIAGHGGRHSSRLVAEAVSAIGAGGMLTGLSLEVDRADGVET